MYIYFGFEVLILYSIAKIKFPLSCNTGSRQVFGNIQFSLYNISYYHSQLRGTAYPSKPLVFTPRCQLPFGTTCLHPQMLVLLYLQVTVQCLVEHFFCFYILSFLLSIVLPVSLRFALLLVMSATISGLKRCSVHVYSHLFCVGVMLYLYYLYFIYACKCSNGFPYLMMFVSCGLTVTRHVALVEQKLPTLPEHLNSLQVLVGFMLLNISAVCSVLQIIVCTFYTCIIYPSTFGF